MRKKIKIIVLLLVVLLTEILLFSVSYADQKDDINSIINDMSGLNNSTGVGSDNSIVKGVNVVYTIIRVAGTGIALLMVMVLGIKYMMTSVEEKAEIKKQAIPILVGSAFIFATSNLLSMVAKVVEE